MDVTAWDRAIQRCERLLDTEATTVLLHGDLHLGNAVSEHGSPTQAFGSMAMGPRSAPPSRGSTATGSMPGVR
ncbi:MULTISPECIES: hypothetical protein [unclassified Streptomyces]|uniref:hypothetical protein n=1 Tax=Streptomyces sp. NPDC055082 TaxID=3365718 RepID=UPI0037D6FA16